jgi:hypothetical protein
MTDVQSLKDDLAFLRGLAQDDGKGLARDGFSLAAVGVIFSVVTLFYWGVYSGPLAGAKVLAYGVWAVGVVVMIAIVEIAKRRLPPSTGGAARAMSMAWNGVGVSMTAGGLGLLAAGWRLQDGYFVLATFPILLFALYGAAWSVAYAALRVGWFALVSAGCFAAAVGEGLLYRTPHQWLVLSIGLLLLVGVPGVAIFNKARLTKTGG